MSPLRKMRLLLSSLLVYSSLCVLMVAPRLGFDLSIIHSQNFFSLLLASVCVWFFKTVPSCFVLKLAGQWETCAHTLWDFVSWLNQITKIDAVMLSSHFFLCHSFKTMLVKDTLMRNLFSDKIVWLGTKSYFLSMFVLILCASVENLQLHVFEVSYSNLMDLTLVHPGCLECSEYIWGDALPRRASERWHIQLQGM